MHPALSVIVFTTLSGAGYGLLAWLAIYYVIGNLPVDPVFGAVSILVALSMVTVGLASSTLHLGRPERALRAFSQWRSSWLSREGVASLTTYVPAVLFGVGLVFFRGASRLWSLSAALSSICAVITVICTAYIYRSLKPIPRWHNNWVVPNYLTLAAMTGVLWLAALSSFFGYAPLHLCTLALVTILLALVFKLAYWRFIDIERAISTPESATGLGFLGKVRLFEAPHTSENYLLKEMGFRIARKHSRKLRNIAIVLAFVLPFALTLCTRFIADPFSFAFCLLAAIFAILGVLIERWLFFAEAKHTVTLYYGRDLGPI